MGYLGFLAAVSCLAGFLGGLTGTGGIIMPPMMIEFFGIDPHLAMGLAQASYIVPSGLATVLLFRKGHLDWRVALAIAIPGCLFSFLAAGYLKPLMGGALLNLFFALCVVMSGGVMLWKSAAVMEPPLSPPWRVPVLVLLGASVGAMAGVTGSGANAVLVPVMVFFGLEVLSVLAACQFFAAIASAAGTAGNVLNMSFDPAQLGFLIAGQVLGISFGVRLAQQMDTARLKRVVGLVCFLAGLFMFVRAAMDL